MDVAHDGEPDGSGSTAVHFIYLVEEDDMGYCYLHFYPDSEVRERGGLVELEADLFAQSNWFERLGTILVEQLPGGCHRFSQHAIQALVLRSSRRMARTSNCGEFEYVAMDSRNSLRN